MKTIVLLSLILLVTSTLAIQSQQGKLNLKNEKKISSPLSKALLTMVQLQSSVKTEQGEQRLFEALDFLQANIGAKRDAENQQFATDQENHERQVQRVSETFNEIQGQITVLTEAVAGLNLEGQSLQSDLTSQREQLHVVAEGQQAEILYLENLNQQYQQDFQDYQDVIDLLGEAINKLQEASGFQEAAWSSFMETNSETFTGFAQNLQMKIKKVRKQVLYQPIIKMFMQLTSSTSTPDSASLQRAQAALADLRTYYQNGQQSLTTNYQATVDEHTSLLDQLSNEVSRFQNQLIPRTEDSIVANQNNLQSVQSALDVENSDLLANQELLVQLDQEFAERQQIHERLSDEYENELSIVQEVQSICSQAYSQ